MSSDIVITSDVAALAEDMANRLVVMAQEAIAARGRMSLCLSGGSTPKTLYALLAGDAFRNRFDWSRIHVFWGDERSVPPDHADSNYRMAHEALLSRVPIPAANVHRMEAEKADLAAAAAAYEATLRAFFGGLPDFDVMLLGMGPDGHTASLFPQTEALRETTRWVVPNRVDKMNTWRMTMTYPVINHSRWICFLVAGKDKADVLKEVLESADRTQFPSQGVKPDNGRMLWLVEQAAATRLTLARA